MRYFILILTAVVLNAKIIDAKQLFNKKVIEVQEQNISITKSYYAKITPDSTKVKTLSLLFSGYVEKLYADKPFMEIKKGDKLFDIYSDEVYKLLQEQRISPVSKRLIAKRFEALHIDQSELQKSRAVTVYSPYSGVVTKKRIFEGDYVQKGKMLYEIVDLSQVWAIAKVYQSDLTFIKEGMEARIEVDGVGSFKTKVKQIYPQVDNRKKTIDIKLVLNNPNLKLYPNMFAKAYIKTKTKRALVLPKTAVLTKGKKHFVFLDRGENYEPKEVEAVRIDARRYEIKSGLKKGERVIDKVMFMLDSDAITNSLYDSDDEDW